MRIMQDTLRTMFNAAQDHMTSDELDTLASGFSDLANNAAQDMSEVVDGIYCLVGTESTIHKERHKKHGFVISGQFAEPDSVMSLMGCISRQFDFIAAMVEISGEARSLNRIRRGEV